MNTIKIKIKKYIKNTKELIVFYLGLNTIIKIEGQENE